MGMDLDSADQAFPPMLLDFVLFAFYKRNRSLGMAKHFELTIIRMATSKVVLCCGLRLRVQGT